MIQDSIVVFSDAESLAGAAADAVARIASEAIAARGRFTLVLAGGSTPRRLYARLAAAGQAGVDWPRVHVFFGDERCVPPDDPASNFRMAAETLLDAVPLPRGQVHRIRGEDDPALAALAYEQEIRRTFRSATPPAFDLVLLGMGDNGHTASLFPGVAALREQVRWVVPQYVEVMHTWRVTLTLPLINAARHVVFLVEGAGKAQTLREVLRGPYQPDVLPAQLIQPAAGRLQWLVDAAAASRLEEE